MTGGRSIRVVVVDVDDTLILTEASSFALENEVLRQLGRDPMPRERHLANWGRPLLDAMPDRSPGLDLAAFADAFTGVFAAHVAAGQIDVVPDENIAALDDLIRVGYRIMLLTSRLGVELDHLLSAGSVLSTRISAAYHGGNMRHAKPSPHAFDELLSDHDLAPEQCVYVGDSPTDAAAANGAGVPFVASLEGGLRTREDFAPYRVDAFIDRFPDLTSVLPTRVVEDRAPRTTTGEGKRDG